MSRKLLVIGATGGIGGAVVREAAARGWTCVTAARMPGAANWELDLADRAGLDLALMRLFTVEAPFDGVAYCAGTCPVLPVSRMDVEKLEEAMLVNCHAFLLVMKHFSRPGAFNAAGAAAVAISSVSAREGWAGGSAYCAAKGALSAACRALSVELAPKNIRVTALEPRYVATRMFRECAARYGVAPSAAQEARDFAREVMESLAK